MQPDLSRFHDAQAGGAHERALAELRAGRKRGHWIWYVLPQLEGLGRSGTARLYGLRGVEEARAYVADPILRARLLEVVEALRAHVAGQGARGARESSLVRVMAGELDAMKAVSSLTLFEGIGDPELAAACTAVLDAAEVQGLPRCEFTQARLAREKPPEATLRPFGEANMP